MARQIVLLLCGLLLLARPVVASEQQYPLHTDVWTTMFYVGEKASEDNAWISNESSAWDVRWVEHFGCVDEPANRFGILPIACYYDNKGGPKQNPFYFALPFGDYDEHGPLPQVIQIPWYASDGGQQIYANGGSGSLLKNRWIEITNEHGGKAYAQWEDTGPMNYDDEAYVFGTAAPKFERSGLDVSPAVNQFLGLEGLAKTSWRFVSEDEVPDGPWKWRVTTTGPDWS